jgi:hypothetical protein
MRIITLKMYNVDMKTTIIPTSTPVPSFVSICQEAEAGTLLSPMTKAGNSPIYITSKAEDRGTATYIFQIRTPGQYVVWARRYSSNAQSDSSTTYGSWRGKETNSRVDKFIITNDLQYQP